MTDDYLDRQGIPQHNPEFNADAFIESRGWRVASTMPKIPHSYTVRRGDDDPEFDRFVALIRERGTSRLFGKREYRYLVIGDLEYWAIHPVINRQRLADRPYPPTTTGSI